MDPFYLLGMMAALVGLSFVDFGDSHHDDPDEDEPTFNGVPAEIVTQSTSGTDGTDWFETETDGVTLEGNAGDDRLEARAEDVTLIGGSGDDDIFGGSGNQVIAGDGNDHVYLFGTVYGDEETEQFEPVSVDGGNGNDYIDISSGDVDAGAGDDRVSAYGPGSYVEGEAGNDFLYVYGLNSEAYGGAGIDYVAAPGLDSRAYGGAGNDLVNADAAGAQAYGDDGNDVLQIESGDYGYGGDGDDVIRVWNRFRDEDGPAIVSGGAGADTFDVRVWRPFNGEADDYYMRVTDFDPAEDILELSVVKKTM